MFCVLYIKSIWKLWRKWIESSHKSYFSFLSFHTYSPFPCLTPAFHCPWYQSPLLQQYFPDPSFLSLLYSPSYFPPEDLQRYFPLPCLNPLIQSPSYLHKSSFNHQIIVTFQQKNPHLSPFCHFMVPYPWAALFFQSPS